MKKFIVAITIIIAASGCGRPALLPPEEKAFNSTNITFDEIKNNILAPKCMACHANLGTYEGVMASGMVIPRNANASPMYLKTASGEMPKGGPALSEVAVKAIFNWINAGAPNGSSGSDTNPPGGSNGGTNPPGGSNGGSNPPQGAQANYDWIQANVFNARCVMCHSGSAASAGLDLTNYDSLKRTVIPFNSTGSVLFQRINNNSMPPGGPALTAEVKKAVADWINAGAVGGTSGGNPNPNPSPTPTQTSTPTTPGVPQPTYAWIQANVLNARCVICHRGAAAPAGLDLTTYENMRKSVIPFNSAGSVLFQRVNNNTMPPGGPALAADVKKAISDWIQNGALQDGAPGTNDPPPPPPLPELAPNFNSIMANIIGPRCLACHDSVQRKGGVVLQTYTNVMRYIRAGNPASSEFYEVIEDNDMPASGGALTSQQKSVIRTWITNGALNN